MFNSDFSNTSYKQEMRIAQIPFSEKPQMKIKIFLKRKQISSDSGKALKGTFVNQTMPRWVT